MLCMRTVSRFVALAALTMAMISCGDVARNSRSPVYLVMDSLQGATGKSSGAGTFSGTLLSDVLVFLTSPAPCTATSPCPTIYDDFGQVVLHLASKDASVAPTSNNQVTITRYHVSYRRADGRNTPGVDVPYGFDGAVTGTVPSSGPLTLAFEIVRHVSKEESPLVQLASSPTIISTIADVTLYGTDQVGNAISATGSISVNFGNFGDQQ